MARKRVTEEPSLKSWEDVNDALRQIAEAQIALGDIESDMQKQVIGAQKAAEEQSRPSIRTLWAIAKSPELGMTDEDLHTVVYRETRKASIKDLTQGEIRAVARTLQVMKDSVRKGGKRTDEGGNAGTVELRRKIYMLAKELGWSPAQVNALAKRMFRIERQEWLDRGQCVKLAEALKAMLARRGQEKTGCP